MAFSFPNMIDIDPEGDVILVIGGGLKERKLRVSAKALSLASSVFKAMLGPRFFRKDAASSEAIPEVSLPDDDPESVIIFCNIAHFRAQNVDISSFSIFERLSLLCDKYDATDAMMPWSTTCFHRDHMIWCYLSEGNAIKMLYVAYAFKNQFGFALASRHLFWNSTDSTFSGLAEDGHGYSVLPTGLLEALMTYRRALVSSIQHDIEEAIRPYLEDSRTNPSCKFESPYKSSNGGARPGLFDACFEPNATTRTTGNTQPTHAATDSNPRTSRFANPGSGNIFANTITGTSTGPSLFGYPQPVTAASGGGLFGDRRPAINTLSTRLFDGPPRFGRSSTDNALGSNTVPSLFGTDSNPFSASIRNNNPTNAHGTPSSLFDNSQARSSNTNNVPAQGPGTQTRSNGQTNTSNGRPDTSHDSIESSPITATVKGVDGSSKTSEGLRLIDSCKSREKIGWWFIELSRLELWPLSTATKRGRLATLLTKLEAFDESERIYHFTVCDCRTCQAKPKAMMASVAENATTKLKGLCLACVKAGKYVPEDGNCMSDGNRCKNAR